MRGSSPENFRSRGQRSQGRDYEDQGRERDQWRDERRFEGDWNQYGSDRNYNQDYEAYSDFEREDRDHEWNVGRGGQYRERQDLGPGRRGSRAWDDSRRGYPRQFTGRGVEDLDEFEDQDRGYYGSPQRSGWGGHTGGFGSARGRYQGQAAQYGGGYGGQWREQPRRMQAPKGYTRSDERIREDVCERLAECQFDISNVSVDVKQGKVTLEGSVSERRMKHQIEDVADNCMGVKDVDNKLRVQREETPARSPESESESGYGGTRFRKEH